MSALSKVQREFQDYLLHGDAAVTARVLGTARVPAAIRLGIYAGAYHSRLSEALASNYPLLAKLLGESDFSALAAEYIAAHDSPFFSIRYYGDGLAQFLDTRQPYAGAPVLAELAQWEWAMTGVFDAADATPLTHAAPAIAGPRKQPQGPRRSRVASRPPLRTKHGHESVRATCPRDTQCRYRPTCRQAPPPRQIRDPRARRSDVWTAEVAYAAGLAASSTAHAEREDPSDWLWPRECRNGRK